MEANPLAAACARTGRLAMTLEVTLIIFHCLKNSFGAWLIKNTLILFLMTEAKKRSCGDWAVANAGISDVSASKTRIFA